jgi:polyphosphate kinase
MRGEDGRNVYTVIQVPSILPRFVALPASRGGSYFLPLEELLTQRLSDICNLYEIRAFGFFRLTRSADFDADEDADNLLEEMKRTVKKRKRGKSVRLELSEGGGGFDEKMKEFLREMLPVSKRFIVELPGFLDLGAFMKIATHKGFDDLRDRPFEPRPAQSFNGGGDIFEQIREGDRFIHHPYESFDRVVDFVMSAAADPDVLAIKQTLYRVSGRSRIIAALEKAAEAGKQVTVLVELKARFDEENNIQWAAQLERAGCHVIYGLTGLKTQCKITLAVRREEDGIRRYLHLSTGNYNDATARVYTDMGLFTCRPAFGADASALFNHLTGFSAPPNYSKLIVAPEHLKSFVLEMLDHEISNAAKGHPCGVSVKVNSLSDADVMEKFFEASRAGVPIKLLVRGICGLTPGVAGFSENIRVRSIVGKFLEHSRVFVFENAGEPLVYLGSADLMPRNLERRVEVVFPVEDAAIKSRITGVLDLMWKDNTNAWEPGSDGEYKRVRKRGKPINSQLELLKGFHL